MIKPGSAWFYGSAAAALALDQISKVVARAALAPYRTVTVVPGVVDLELSFNSGGAFGLLPNWTPLFIIAALTAVYAIVRISRHSQTSRGLAAGLGLLMGGALGNLADRLLSPAKEVTDFISVHIAVGGRDYAWPTFNIADTAIVAGAILLLFNIHIVDKARGARN